MASITTRKNGSRFITFHDAAGNPRHITLGQVAKRYAEAFKVRVEDLAAAALHGHSPSDDTSRWLSSLEDRLYAKLASVGLVPERQSATIGTLVERYIAERKDDLKPESTRKLRQTETKLLAFFDKEKSLRKITAEDATAWRRSLKDLGLSEAAIRTHCGNVKTMLGEAKRRKVIDANPFDTLKSGPTPSKYTRYITPDEIQRVIDACPDAEWRLLFGLARYAGLRIPSESHRLTWADVDFERARLTVHSPKTERWEGHDQRVVPITPRLMTLLRDRFETMPEGEAPLVTIGGKGAVIRRVRRIRAKASVGGRAVGAVVADAALVVREGVGDDLPAVRREPVDRAQHHHQRQALRQRRAGRTLRAGGKGHGLRAAPGAAEGVGWGRKRAETGEWRGSR